MSIQVLNKEQLSLLCELFETAESSIKIISPFISMEMAQLLVDNMRNDTSVEVTIVTRFKREDFIKGVSSIGALEKLHEAGSKIYALKRLHTKLYLFDDDVALLGSANFTSGGFRFNHELLLCIEAEKDVNPVLKDHFDDLVKDITDAGDFLLTTERIAEEKQKVAEQLERRTNPNVKTTSTAQFGADLPQHKDEPDAVEHDPIQNILSDMEIKEYSEKIWLKFEGENDNRMSLSVKYNPFVPRQFPGGITCYPTTRRPSVADGDYVYIAAVSENDKGHTVLPHIVGRGRLEGYRSENVATPEMIEENDWMVDYSNYCLFDEFEYIDANIGECIPLLQVLRDVGSNTYPSTMGKSIPLEDLRNRHYQKATLRLTAHAKSYIDRWFDDLAEKHGVVKL